MWRAVTGFAGWTDAVDFAHVNPPQGAGESVAGHNADGAVNGAYFF
ncbi:hypothetical protein [Streptomyces sp. URMC 124]